MASRLGTSRCSVILPKEIRRGAYALDEMLVFAGREAAKMRPSEGPCCATAGSRAARDIPAGNARDRTWPAEMESEGSANEKCSRNGAPVQAHTAASQNGSPGPSHPGRFDL